MEPPSSQLHSGDSAYIISGARVGLRRPTADDREEFLAMVHASAHLQRPWALPPATREQFLEYLQSRDGQRNDGFLICQLTGGQILGVVNLNNIVLGNFHSAYLGYYISASAARRGFMTEALSLAIGHAFKVRQLHRLEANIQSGNTASIALARKLGFRKEGVSPRYLRIDGEWRDHERWALLADDA